MTKYATHVFDCDGVLLRSNAGKSQAFYLAALPYGDEAAARMKQLHRTAGSISRRERWERFFDEILERPLNPQDDRDVEELRRVVEATTLEVRRATSAAGLMPGALNLLERLRDAGAKRVVISGIETPELDEIIREHGLGGYFEHVEGGPRRKGEVLRDAIQRGHITLPAVYYGDTEDDYEAADSAGLDFVLVEGDSEWADRQSWLAVQRDRVVNVIQDFRQLEAPLPAGDDLLVDREGYVEVEGERLYVGRTLAGARVSYRPEAWGK